MTILPFFYGRIAFIIAAFAWSQQSNAAPPASIGDPLAFSEAPASKNRQAGRTESRSGR
jgi:hypothetical protein